MKEAPERVWVRRMINIRLKLTTRGILPDDPTAWCSSRGELQHWDVTSSLCQVSSAAAALRPLEDLRSKSSIFTDEFRTLPGDLGDFQFNKYTGSIRLLRSSLALGLSVGREADCWLQLNTKQQKKQKKTKIKVEIAHRCNQKQFSKLCGSHFDLESTLSDLCVR